MKVTYEEFIKNPEKYLNEYKIYVVKGEETLVITINKVSTKWLRSLK